MTAQVTEKIIFKGEQTDLACEPLTSYLERQGIKFRVGSTNCWRGYRGTWELKDDRLYLIELKAYLDSVREPVGVDYLFPGQSEAFAYWFTGDLRLPLGEILVYIHMGFQSIYERDLFLTFENGILIRQEETNNRDWFNSLNDVLNMKD